MTRAIETNGLTRRFGDCCALDGLVLQVDRGKFCGFLGPNGAGKSTAMKMLTDQSTASFRLGAWVKTW